MSSDRIDDLTGWNAIAAAYAEQPKSTRSMRSLTATSLTI